MADEFIRRQNDVYQERMIVPFDHPSPGAAAAAATSTVTCDTNGNTTQADWFVLNDGQRIYGFELDVAGTGAEHHIAETAATCSITCASGESSKCSDTWRFRLSWTRSSSADRSRASVMDLRPLTSCSQRSARVLRSRRVSQWPAATALPCSVMRVRIW